MYSKEDLREMLNLVKRKSITDDQIEKLISDFDKERVKAVKQFLQNRGGKIGNITEEQRQMMRSTKLNKEAILSDTQKFHEDPISCFGFEDKKELSQLIEFCRNVVASEILKEKGFNNLNK